jgi:hypothetical protein
MFKVFLGLVLILGGVVFYIFFYNPNPPKGKLVAPIVKEIPADSYTEKDKKELNKIFE